LSVLFFNNRASCSGYSIGRILLHKSSNV
jgi:hypothetical protein